MTGHSTNNRNLLIIFLKAPTPGKVKTRLQPDLTPRQSSELYRSMVEDLLSQFRGKNDFSIRIQYSPADAGEEIRDWLGDRWELRPQAPGNLGDRMYQALREAAGDGYLKMVLIGSDLPTLTKQTIQEAFARLDKHRLVLGPSDDGGYYLIALQTPRRFIFENIPWSSDKVLKKTMNRADWAGWYFSLLNPARDIDTYQDVLHLWSELQTGGSSYNRFRLMRTYKTLSKILTGVVPAPRYHHQLSNGER